MNVPLENNKYYLFTINTFTVFVVRMKFKAHFAGAIVSAQRIYTELLASMIHRSAFVVLCKNK